MCAVVNSDKKCDHSGLIGRPSQICQAARIQTRPNFLVTRTVATFFILTKSKNHAKLYGLFNVDYGYVRAFYIFYEGQAKIFISPKMYLCKHVNIIFHISLYTQTLIDITIRIKINITDVLNEK